ncbi:MAG: DUF1264 domain-containing protein [Candidatus Eremiobacteraeota bacterium]|nr:DUF1264 domain-containing protein [Candidatus Eremiobacteraeota bacterium]
MRKLSVLALLVAGFGLGLLVARIHPGAVDAASINPSEGWTIHIDAQRHFGDANPTEIAHHWCKPVSGGMLECQIYDSDTANARLVEVETIVQPATWKSFTAGEQALWHYHKDEIPKISATLPDMTPDQAKAAVASILDTYGKVYMLWDPKSTPDGNPIGQPSVVVLK